LDRAMIRHISETVCPTFVSETVPRRRTDSSPKMLWRHTSCQLLIRESGGWQGWRRQLSMRVSNNDSPVDVKICI